MSNLTRVKTLDNRVLIDYLTITYDDFEIYTDNNGNSIINNLDLFNELLTIFGYGGMYLNLKADKALQGFKNGYRLGEHIRISYGGIQSHGTEVLMLSMTGQACREFENNMNGDWLDLLDFTFNRINSKRITRLDFAYDDFNAKYFTLYDLLDFVRTGNYTSTSRKWSLVESGERKDNGSVSLGLTVYIGSKGGNQLVMYNKKLERYNAGEYDLDVDQWYRYELQFSNDMAEAVAERYFALSLENNSYEFMNFYFELLTKSFEPKDPLSKRARVRERVTWQPWLDFINYARKTDIKTKHRIDPTLDKKKSWYDYAITSTQIEFSLAMGLKGTERFLYQSMLNAIDEFEKKPGKMARVNNYLDDKNEIKKTSTDIELLKNEIKKKLKEHERK